MKIRHMWFVPLLLLLLLTACASPGNVTPSITGEAGITEAPDNPPVNVDVSLDSSHAVTQLVPVSGGTLSTTAADGTVFTLEIPNDALINETEITMTPIEVSDMPEGYAAGPGVHLEPESLNLFNFATLTITPTEEIPIDQQIFFGYEGEGENLSLALPDPQSGETKILLLHFSGYFEGSGNLEGIAIALPERGGAVVQELSNRVAELTQRERQRQKLEGRKPLAPELSSELAKLFQEYYDRYVKVYLDISGESCSKGGLAIDIYGHYSQLMRKAGLGDRIVEVDYLALVEKVAGTCLQEEYNLCVKDHVVHRMLPFLLGLDRQMQLTREVLGLGEESASSSALLQQARQLTEQCLRFELEFTSSSTGPAYGGDAGGGGIIEVAVSAKVPIRFDAATLQLSGEAPLVHEKFRAEAEFCTTITYPADGFVDGNFSAYLSWVVEKSIGVESGEIVLRLSDLRLRFDVESQDIFGFGGNCAPGLVLGPDYVSHWDWVFAERHSDQFCGVLGSGGPRLEALCAGSTGIYIFEGWEVLGEELFAVLDWQKQGLYTETGSFMLYHRPGK